MKSLENLNQAEISSLIKQLPKAELHIHLEGSFEPEQMLQIAKRNGISLPYSHADEIKKEYQFTCLQDFLDIYHQATTVLRTEQDFYDLTTAYLQKARADQVLHAEIFIDLQTHAHHGDAPKRVIGGAHRASRDAAKNLGITSELIVTFLRHESEEDALNLLEEIKPYREQIVAIGLASSEYGNPPSKFKRAFQLAREQGYHLVAHAGEEQSCGAAYIKEALSTLQIERIDHGVQAITDVDLMKTLVQKQIPLTVCPFSNVKLAVVPNLSHHMLKKLFDAGLMVTINSDDPAYFGGYINDNFTQTISALNMNASSAIQIAKNSFNASFISDTQKRSYLDRLDHSINTFLENV